jgi:hypothetical protein
MEYYIRVGISSISHQQQLMYFVIGTGQMPLHADGFVTLDRFLSRLFVHANDGSRSTVPLQNRTAGIIFFSMISTVPNPFRHTVPLLNRIANARFAFFLYDINGTF